VTNNLKLEGYKRYQRARTSDSKENGLRQGTNTQCHYAPCSDCVTLWSEYGMHARMPHRLWMGAAPQRLYRPVPWPSRVVQTRQLLEDCQQVVWQQHTTWYHTGVHVPVCTQASAQDAAPAGIPNGLATAYQADLLLQVCPNTPPPAAVAHALG
jgi:hypothetical protein